MARSTWDEFLTVLVRNLGGAGDGIQEGALAKAPKFCASIWVQMLMWGSRFFGKS